MFLLDSLMISGIRWALTTVVTAAEAEMNDDTALRERLLEAEMRRETGEISDDDFAALEADLLARIREIKERREGSGPLAFGAQPIETSPDSRFQIEASVSGDFHAPASEAHTASVASPLRDPGAGRSLPAEAGSRAKPAGRGAVASGRRRKGAARTRAVRPRRSST